MQCSRPHYSRKPKADPPLKWGVARKKRNKTMEAFGERLRQARAAKYDSAEAFAEMMGLNPHRYRKWERGETNPPLAELQRVCTALGVTTDDLLSPKPKRPVEAA